MKSETTRTGRSDAVSSCPMLTIPESVYHEPLTALRGPPAIVWVTDPALVKIVLVDHCDDFPQDQLLRRVLGGLFGNSILTSEGRDWRWQHQMAAPLFRHGEILRYVPAMVAVAESAIKAWSAAPPGSTHAIDADMLRATYHVISNIFLPGGGALIGETMKRGTADYVEGIISCHVPRSGKPASWRKSGRSCPPALSQVSTLTGW